MASVVYLDTHVVAWLYATGKERLSEGAADRIRGTKDLRISPMVRLELQYLYEIDRVGAPPMPVLDTLSSSLGLTLCHTSFPAVVREAERHHWTRDPFDRLIVAQASLHNAALLTKDAAIHEHYRHASW